MRLVVLAAVCALVPALLASGATATVSASSATSVRTAAATSTQVRLATFNVRTSERGGPAWAPRRKRVLELLRRTRADVVVLQEADVIEPYRLDADGVAITPARRFPALWLARKAGYQLVGQPAGFGVRAHYWSVGAQILYKPGRLSLHSISCGVGYTAASKYATFTDRRTGRTFRVVGVHLRPGRGKAADESRIRSLGYYDRHARTCASPTFDSVPTVWFGDMNTPASRAGTALGDNLRSRGLRDTVRVAERRHRSRLNTFHPGRRARLDGKRLDQIWVPTRWRVLRWTQIADVRDGRYVGRFASDHNPVVATVRLR